MCLVEKYNYSIVILSKASFLFFVGKNDKYQKLKLNKILLVKHGENSYFYIKEWQQSKYYPKNILFGRRRLQRILRYLIH